MIDNEIKQINNSVQHIFIIGSKCIGQYGGYETFVDKLTEQHMNDTSIKYHIACKANGVGFMDETKLDSIEVSKTSKDGVVVEFTYHNAHVFKIPCPNIGPAVAIYYDRASIIYSINYCKRHNIKNPIFYILTCRIGMFIDSLTKQIKEIGGIVLLNPDGHEWMRAKWSKPVKKYWKWSEKKMVFASDIIVCDSLLIKKYIIDNYNHQNTRYISYGADIEKSHLSDDHPKFTEWIYDHGIRINEYYLIVGRFVPENNYESMIREFMKTSVFKDLVIISNVNDKLKKQLEKKLHFSTDKRIKFVGTVYDKELLKKIRENSFGYLHGHEVGGTNPSLLEALGLTKLNLLLDVGFNREVGQDSAFYWSKDVGDLSKLINRLDNLSFEEISKYDLAAKERIKSAYSWPFIANEYKKLWIQVQH